MDSDDTTKSKSLCSLDGEHLKAQQNLEQDKYSSGNSTFIRPEFFRNNVSILVLYALLENSLTGTEDDEVTSLWIGPLCGRHVQMLELGLL